MITGRLQAKNGRYYMILNLKDERGKYMPKWIATGLPTKGNKDKAELILQNKIKELEARSLDNAEMIIFSDYMETWLEIIRNSVTESTFTSYRRVVKNSVVPYFNNLGVTLAKVERQPEYIQNYYRYLIEERKHSAATVRRHHANIRKALQYAVKINLTTSNPADKVEKPKVLPYFASYYDEVSLNTLFEKLRGTKLYLPVLLASFYGLRRSEVLGLRWSAIDFRNKTITICHTVTSAVDDEGRHYLVLKNQTKTKSSTRIFPLIPQVEEALFEKKTENERNMLLHKKVINKNFLDYVHVDECGKLLNPNYISAGFAKHLEANNLKRIRFHDLRHSCASLLLKSGINLKMIQEWLGHSDFSTTFNLYTHLDIGSKKESAIILSNLLLPTDA